MLHEVDINNGSWECSKGRLSKDFASLGLVQTFVCVREILKQET